ncbi:GNAT family N-acetyltransferase [Nakamurella lactea]|uniref:GNAT family N-acetyltransferase n=1 Tax=Nakamurella lactea TaxID=459515 RepID=UPI0003F59B8A
MLTAFGARTLGPAHAERVAEALAADPVAGCLVAERFEACGMDRTALGGQFWGVAGGRDAVAFVGGNLIPLTGTPVALRQLAAGLGRRRRTVASMVGSAGQVLPLWQFLESKWGPARDVRPDQPLLVCQGRPLVAPDEQVHQVPAHRLDEYLPAAIAMFTEEVGVDPCRGDRGVGYRHRVQELMLRGQAFARFDGDRLVFKAEIGALSSQVAMIQGVWVDPRYRGRGIAAPGMAAVVRHIQDGVGRLPSLYVNQHNYAARAAYHRVGFHQVGTFASVLF